MKTFLLSTYYHILSFTRVKIAVFFSFVFPIFIFLAFSFIWGYNNPAYYKFLLTGVIIMKVMSDALYTIGQVIVGYYKNGLVKFFKGLSYSFMKYIGALVVSRILISFVTSLVLLVIGIIVFHIKFSAEELIYVVLGITAAFMIFSFIGWSLAIITADKSRDLSLLNLVLFIMIFFSNIFYPLEKLNPSIWDVVHFLPVNPVLALTRGNISNIYLVIVWLILSMAVFFASFRLKGLR